MQLAAQNVLGASCQGGELKRNMAKLRLLASYDPIDAIALRRRVAGRLLDAERYVF
jgi:hypothetical protein